MSILDEFGIRRGDVVSIVGAGGKTTLMFRLANALRADGMRILVTTTTKIHVPMRGQYDYMFIGADSVFPPPKPCICVLGAGINHRGKLTAPDAEDLRSLTKSFDVTLIEADGARERLLKAWAAHEPDVPIFTTKTVAVFNLALLGKLPSEETIHRLPIFLKLCELDEGEPISFNALRKLLTKPDGILKGATGCRILYINRVLDENSRREAIEFIESFTPDELSRFDRIVI